jgi:hypothetical protein
LGAEDFELSECRRRKRSGRPVLCLRNGSQFKSEGADQLRISPKMSWQLTPLVMSHNRIKIGQPPWLPQRIMGPGPIGRDVAACGQVVLRSSPRGSKSQGARHRRAAAWWSPAGSVLEPVRPETAGDIPRDLTSRPTTSRPNEQSWDFDGNEQDFGEEKNPPKPHANP